MKKLALVALALVLGLAVLFAAGCGGNKVPQGAIGTVGGVPITQAQFDQYINQAKASAGQNGQAAFPSAGTATYNRYAAEIVNYLVEQQVVLNGAAAQKISVSDADVQSQLSQIAAQYGGTQKMYAAAQKAGMNADQLKTYVKNSLLGQKLYQQIIGKVAPTEAQMQAYYKAHKASFNQKATRTVRHVLVKTKAQALKVQALLAANNTTANWAKVAKQYSIDTGTKNSGGSLGPITRGQMVKPFENAAFALPLNKVSVPVKSQYGWHVLEVTAITPAKASTYASAKANIKSTLTSQMQQKAWQTWLTAATKAADDQVRGGLRPRRADPSPERLAVALVDQVRRARPAVPSPRRA